MKSYGVESSGRKSGAEELRLTAGEGCAILKRKTVKLMHSSDNALVIYHARALLNEAGFHRTDEYILAAAASELATNIVRYTSGGEIDISLVRDARGRTGVEIFASDSGPGIQNIEIAMREHYSFGIRKSWYGASQRQADYGRVRDRVGRRAWDADPSKEMEGLWAGLTAHL